MPLNQNRLHSLNCLNFTLEMLNFLRFKLFLPGLPASAKKLTMVQKIQLI